MSEEHIDAGGGINLTSNANGGLPDLQRELLN